MITNTPLAEIDGAFRNLGGPGDMPFQLEEGMAINGLSLSSAPPQAVARAPETNNSFASIIGGHKPNMP